MLKEIIEILKKPELSFEYVIMICNMVCIGSLVILVGYIVVFFVLKMFPVVPVFWNLIFGT
jgi:hypothetical protein